MLKRKFQKLKNWNGNGFAGKRFAYWPNLRKQVKGSEAQ